VRRQLRPHHLPADGHFIMRPIYAESVTTLWEADMTCVPHALQTVQLQLTSSEKADKDDASPVTIADYGEPTGQSGR
jgi:hypothetical protein